MSPRQTAAARKAAAARLGADARNRAVRTFVQGLVIDLAVALAVTVYAVASSPDPIVWGVVAASLARSAVQAVASYVMRRYVDGSRIPTPTPPGDAGHMTPPMAMVIILLLILVLFICPPR